MHQTTLVQFFKRRTAGANKSAEEDEPHRKRPNIVSSFNLIEKQGDLFTSTDSLVHCVSQCLTMGKGIAVAFKRQFGGIAELKEQPCSVGDCPYLQRGDRYIFYMITKPMYMNKPSKKKFTQALISLRNQCNALNITKLSMPRIGCGLDNLDWDWVKQLIQNTFQFSNIQITVYEYNSN